MRTDDGVLCFAPGISFEDVAWYGNTLPSQFCDRIEGFYLAPAESCISQGYAFAAGLLLVSSIDALARLKYRSSVVGQRFIKILKEIGDIPDRFYDEVRNGLVHEARLKNGAQFTLNQTITKAITFDGATLLVQPKYLLVEVRKSLRSYIKLLEENEHECRLLSASLMLDLEKDILTAQQYRS